MSKDKTLTWLWFSATLGQSRPTARRLRHSLYVIALSLSIERCLTHVPSPQHGRLQRLSHKKIVLTMTKKTRMHSSRKRTVRFSCHLGGGSAWGGGCVFLGGVCLRVGCLPGGVCLAVGGVCPVRCTPPPPIVCWDTHSTPVNRMTDRCKNITFSQTSFAGGKYQNLRWKVIIVAG